MGKLLAFALITAAAAHSTVLWVNKDASSYVPPGTGCTQAGYTTIQAAVNAASPGDGIRVCPGLYAENVTIDKAGLTVVSTDGALATAIQAPVSAYTVFITRPNVTLDGFTITPHGHADSDIAVNVGIEGEASVVIVHNNIRGGRIGVNLGCVSSASTVAHNTVRGASEAGINVDTCEAPPFPGSNYNSVHHNTVCGGLYPYSIAVGGSSSFNDVHHNQAIWISVGGSGNQVHHNIATLFLVAPGNNAHNNTIADPCQ
jgi:hypothetical protein